MTRLLLPNSRVARLVEAGPLTYPHYPVMASSSFTAAHHQALETLARLGYAVKGVVYGLVGVLAVQAAFGMGGETTGSRGAIDTIAGSPFGQVLLWIVGIGLVGYTLWRFAQSILNVEAYDDDAKGYVKRIALAGSGVLYGALAFSVFKTLLGNGGGSGGSSGAQTWTARLMEQPAGPWLVGLAGVIAICVGLFQFYRAYEASFLDKWKTGEMSSAERSWGEKIARFGLAARGVVFCFIGYFVIQAALQSDPSEARGLNGVLDTMSGWVLGIVALGFVAYGLYCLLNARYRTIAGA